jgi:hypothetical protein
MPYLAACWQQQKQQACWADHATPSQVTAHGPEARVRLPLVYPHEVAITAQGGLHSLALLALVPRRLLKWATRDAPSPQLAGLPFEELCGTEAARKHVLHTLQVPCLAGPCCSWVIHGQPGWLAWGRGCKSVQCCRGRRVQAWDEREDPDEGTHVSLPPHNSACLYASNAFLVLAIMRFLFAVWVTKCPCKCYAWFLPHGPRATGSSHAVQGRQSLANLAWRHVHACLAAEVTHC